MIKSRHKLEIKKIYKEVTTEEVEVCDASTQENDVTHGSAYKVMYEKK